MSEGFVEYKIIVHDSSIRIWPDITKAVLLILVEFHYGLCSSPGCIITFSITNYLNVRKDGNMCASNVSLENALIRIYISTHYAYLSSNLQWCSR